MGWRGTIRSVNAELNRQAKRAERNERLLQKQDAQENARNIVSQQNNQLDTASSIHEVCNANLNWDRIRKEVTPNEPFPVTYRTDIAQGRIDRFQSNFFDKTFRLTEWRKNRLKKLLKLAHENDQKEYIKSYDDYRDKRLAWEKRQDFVERMNNNDSKVYIDIIAEFGTFSDIPLGKSISFAVNDKHELSFDIIVNPYEDIVPDEEYSLRQSGTLSSKKMSKLKGGDIYQDYVCSCLLRASREVFGLLPIASVQANALLYSLNLETGHFDNQVLVSAIIQREVIERINFIRIDPSEALKNFIHNMSFTKSKGLGVVERIDMP